VAALIDLRVAELRLLAAHRGRILAGATNAGRDFPSLPRSSGNSPSADDVVLLKRR